MIESWAAAAAAAIFTAQAGSVPAPQARALATAEQPETVQVPSGSLKLTALVWRPSGSGPFPAVLFNHGAGRTRTDPSRASILGPVFARHGYVFLYLFRRGDGLSAGQGAFMGDLLEQERAAKGEEARIRLQVSQLTTDQLDDVRAGLSFLKKLPGVDAGRVAVAGHSFGAQLAILAAGGDPTLRAAVAFAPAAILWNESAEARERLLSAARGSTVPLMMVFAANDYSTAPGEAIAAERSRSGRQGELKIYPAFGKTPAEGHGIVYRAISFWEEDVFRFLDGHLRPEAESAGILGQWHGTSICTNRDLAPACKDEEVLYTFTRAAEGTEGRIHLKADKLVGSEFETMGEIDFTYDAAAKQWKSEFQGPRFHGLWSYAVDGRRLSGTLVDLPSGALIRRISCERK